VLGQRIGTETGWSLPFGAAGQDLQQQGITGIPLGHALREGLWHQTGEVFLGPAAAGARQLQKLRQIPATAKRPAQFRLPGRSGARRAVRLSDGHGSELLAALPRQRV
jgi:hypothetical protein